MEQWIFKTAVSRKCKLTSWLFYCYRGISSDFIYLFDMVERPTRSVLMGCGQNMWTQNNNNLTLFKKKETYVEKILSAQQRDLPIPGMRPW
jgi:hypothetical protein